MAFLFPRWTNRIPLFVAVGGPVALAAVAAGVWYWFSPWYTDVGYQPPQPVPFSHKLHAGDLGMDCRYCHNTIERGAMAAIPPTQTCMNCHEKLILPESVRLAPLRTAYITGSAMPWVRVHMLPGYVYFNHSVHLAAGVGCVNCHGRIDQMAVVHQVKPLSMSWCLECHRNPKPYLGPRSEVTNLAYVPRAAGYDPDHDPQRSRTVHPPLHCSGCHR